MILTGTKMKSALKTTTSVSLSTGLYASLSVSLPVRLYVLLMMMSLVTLTLCSTSTNSEPPRSRMNHARHGRPDQYKPADDHRQNTLKPITRPDQTGYKQPVTRPDQTGYKQSVTRPDQNGHKPVTRPEQTGYKPAARSEQSILVPRPEQAGYRPVTRPVQTGQTSSNKPDGHKPNAVKPVSDSTTWKRTRPDHHKPVSDKQVLEEPIRSPDSPPHRADETIVNNVDSNKSVVVTSLNHQTSEDLTSPNDHAMTSLDHHGDNKRGSDKTAGRVVDGVLPVHVSNTGVEGVERMTPPEEEESGEVGHLVNNLHTQLKEAQLTHMHTRSVINVLQEKQDAQETNLAFLKDALSRLTGEYSHQREDLASLKAGTSNAEWAIADVKHGQAQVASDLSALKRVQDELAEDVRAVKRLQSLMNDDISAVKAAQTQSLRDVSREVERRHELERRQESLSSDVRAMRHVQDQQNETLLVMEEVIMSNALELQSLHKHDITVRHEMAQLRSQIADDKLKSKVGHNTIVNSKPPRIKEIIPNTPSHNADPVNNAGPAVWSGTPEAGSRREWENERPKNWKATNSNEWIKTDKFGEPPSKAERAGNLAPTRLVDEKIKAELTDSIAPIRAVEANSIDDVDTDVRDRLVQSPHNVEGVHEAGQESRSKMTSHHNPHEFSAFKTIIQGRLESQESEIRTLYLKLNNLSTSLTSSVVKLDDVTQRQAVDREMLSLQEAFINYTRQIFELDRARRRMQNLPPRSDPQIDGQIQSNDITRPASDNSGGLMEERVRTLEREHRTFQEQLHGPYNESLVQLLRATSLDRDDLAQHETRSSRILGDIEERLRELTARQWLMDELVRRAEQAAHNATLLHCRETNTDLMNLINSGDVQHQLAGLEVKAAQQALASNKLEMSMSNLVTELAKHTDMTSSAVEQTTSLQMLPGQVTSLHREILNFVLQLPSDCSDVHGGQPISDGIYLIRPKTANYSLRVFCLAQSPLAEPDRVGDGTEGGEEEQGGRDGEEDAKSAVWMVVQRRQNGRETFARTWNEYKTGFGDPSDEFWIGNEPLHRLTDGGGDRTYKLRVDMWDVQGRYWVARYASVHVHSEEHLYRLDLGHYSGGNATDALRYSNLMPFSSIDRDNDVSTTHCAQFYQSGWWYKHCHYSNLNGRYTSGLVWFNDQLDEWLQMNRTVITIGRVMQKGRGLQAEILPDSFDNSESSLRDTV